MGGCQLSNIDNESAIAVSGVACEKDAEYSPAVHGGLPLGSILPHKASDIAANTLEEKKSRGEHFTIERQLTEHPIRSPSHAVTADLSQRPEVGLCAGQMRLQRRTELR